MKRLTQLLQFLEALVWMVMVVRVLALLSAAAAVAGLLLGLTVALPDCVVCLLLTVVVCFQHDSDQGYE